MAEVGFQFFICYHRKNSYHSSYIINLFKALDSQRIKLWQNWKSHNAAFLWLFFFFLSLS